MCEEVDIDRVFADQIVLIFKVQRLKFGLWATTIGRYVLYILLWTIFFYEHTIEKSFAPLTLGI